MHAREILLTKLNKNKTYILKITKGQYKIGNLHKCMQYCVTQSCNRDTKALTSDDQDVIRVGGSYYN